MKWVIKRTVGEHYQANWRSLWAVYVDERRAEMFGQKLSGEWVVMGYGTAKFGELYLTKRAARRAALISAGIDPDATVTTAPTTIVPAAFYEDARQDLHEQGGT